MTQDSYSDNELKHDKKVQDIEKTIDFLMQALNKEMHKEFKKIIRYKISEVRPDLENDLKSLKDKAKDFDRNKGAFSDALTHFVLKCETLQVPLSEEAQALIKIFNERSNSNQSATQAEEASQPFFWFKLIPLNRGALELVACLHKALDQALQKRGSKAIEKPLNALRNVRHEASLVQWNQAHDELLAALKALVKVCEEEKLTLSSSILYQIKALEKKDALVLVTGDLYRMAREDATRKFILAVDESLKAGLQQIRLEYEDQLLERDLKIHRLENNQADLQQQLQDKTNELEQTQQAQKK